MKKILFALTLLLTLSCSKDKEVDYVAQNEKEIVAYIAANKLIAQKSSTGLHYVINDPGTGAQPTSSSNVTVAYKGYYTNGNVFDKSSDAGISFGLQQVIKGWTEGIAYFKVGGNGILLIPSHLGYGSNDSNGIPGGSVLIFDVKLVGVN